MAVRPIVIAGEPVLHRPATRVAAFDGDLRQLVADMFDTMDAAHGVGLAAPQIGVPLRLFVYEMANDDDVPPRGVIINPMLSLPKISTDRPDPDTESEGCLSVPGRATRSSAPTASASSGSTRTVRMSPSRRPAGSPG